MEISLLRNWKRNLVDCQWISLMNMNASLIEKSDEDGVCI